VSLTVSSRPWASMDCSMAGVASYSERKGTAEQ
jgi:hypothetical protein